MHYITAYSPIVALTAPALAVEAAPGVVLVPVPSVWFEVAVLEMTLALAVPVVVNSLGLIEVLALILVLVLALLFLERLREQVAAIPLVAVVELVQLMLRFLEFLELLFVVLVSVPLLLVPKLAPIVSLVVAPPRIAVVAVLPLWAVQMVLMVFEDFPQLQQAC